MNMNELVSVDLNGLDGRQLEEAYGLVNKLGPSSFLLHVDKRVLASSLTPKSFYKFTDKKAPLGAVNISGLRMQLKAIEVAATLIDSGLLSEPDVEVERVSFEDVQAEFKTGDAEEGGNLNELRQRAKEAGIRNYWRKNAETLEAELEALPSEEL